MSKDKRLRHESSLARHYASAKLEADRLWDAKDYKAWTKQCIKVDRTKAELLKYFAADMGVDYIPPKQLRPLIREAEHATV